MKRVLVKNHVSRFFPLCNGNERKLVSWTLILLKLFFYENPSLRADITSRFVKTCSLYRGLKLVQDILWKLASRTITRVLWAKVLTSFPITSVISGLKPSSDDYAVYLVSPLTKLNNASLAFGRTSAGSVWCFLGALWHNPSTCLMCINKIMSFVTDDWMNFIVFVLPEEVKVYTLFREKAS